MSDRDLKIKVSIGCADYLVGEIETLRRENELLRAEKRIVDSFFKMFDRMGDLPRTGMAEDRMWQAKKEIESAKHTALQINQPVAVEK